jgi:8-oxo-dGTP diphosphatase
MPNVVRLLLLNLKKREHKLSDILNRADEQKFIEDYRPGNYPSIAYTADIVVFTIINGKLSLLLIKRGNYPYKDCWALPGGFVEPDEDSEAAASRELQEETGLGIESAYLEQLKTYSTPNRDPRMRVVSSAYIAFIPFNELGMPQGGDDAKEAHFFAVEDIFSGEEPINLAFDHQRIILDGIERAQSKLEYTPLATEFLPDEFTLSDLRRVYEAVWETSLHPSNFRRKILSTPNFVTPVGLKGGSTLPSGRNADLYVAGNARILHPAILRNVD